MKKLMVLMIVGVLLVSTSVLSYAESASSPADILDNLTDLSLEEIYQERGNGMRIGELASKYNVYEAFKEAFTVEKLDVLKVKLNSGELSQDEYDAFISLLEACDGTGENRVLENVGMQFGKSSKSGFGKNANSTGRGFNRNN